MINEKISYKSQTFYRWTQASYKRSVDSNNVECADRSGSLIKAIRTNAVINAEPIRDRLKQGMKVLIPIARDKYNRNVWAESDITELVGSGDSLVVKTSPPRKLS